MPWSFPLIKSVGIFFLTTWLNLRNKCGSLVTVQINLQPSPPPSYCAFPPCICHFNCSTFFISSKFLHSVTYFWHYKFISFCSLLFANYYNSVMLPFCRTNVQPSSSSPCHSSGSLESLIESFQKQLTFEWTLLLLAINFVSFHCCGKKMALLFVFYSPLELHCALKLQLLAHQPVAFLSVSLCSSVCFHFLLTPVRLCRWLHCLFPVYLFSPKLLSVLSS